jgi:DNA-binding transcriptional regulator YhcF (GntR family)
MAELGGAKITVFSHIVKNINPISNEFGGTNREIAEDTGVSLSIVNQTIQDLIRMGFMNKKRVACYVINPNILLKGTHGKRMGLLRIYQSNE